MPLTNWQHAAATAWLALLAPAAAHLLAILLVCACWFFVILGERTRTSAFNNLCYNAIDRDGVFLTATSIVQAWTLLGGGTAHNADNARKQTANGRRIRWRRRALRLRYRARMVPVTRAAGIALFFSRSGGLDVKDAGALFGMTAGDGTASPPDACLPFQSSLPLPIGGTRAL